MWFGLPPESNRRCRIESEIRIRSLNSRRFGFQQFDRIDEIDFQYKLIDFRLNQYKIDLFRYIFELLINLNRYNVNYLIENSWFISKIYRILVEFEPNLSILSTFGRFTVKFDQCPNNILYEISLFESIFSKFKIIILIRILIKNIRKTIHF